MNKIRLDPETREQFVKAGKKGGEKTIATNPPEHFKHIGNVGWEALQKKNTPEEIRKNRSEAGKKGAAIRWGKRRMNLGIDK